MRLQAAVVSNNAVILSYSSSFVSTTSTLSLSLSLSLDVLQDNMRVVDKNPSPPNPADVTIKRADGFLAGDDTPK